MDQHGAGHAAVYVLDADPDLAQGIPETERAEARRRALARVIPLESTRWNPDELPGPPGPEWMGLLIIDGLLLRQVLVGQRSSCELFGPGDVLRPWDQDAEYDPLPVTVSWRVVQTGRLALLDGGFARRVARWPTVTVELMRRISSRARTLSLAAAVTHLPRTRARLLLLFWLLANRWGRVTPDGVLVNLPLTHNVLAMLVGNRRPSVTIALQQLAADGLLVRQAYDRWLLTNEGISALEQPPS